MSALDDLIAKNTTAKAAIPSVDSIPVPKSSSSTSGSALDQFIRSSGGKNESTSPSTDTPEAPKKNFLQKYLDFSDRLGQLGGEFDVGITKGIGSVVGGLETAGHAVGSVGFAIDHALGGHAVQESTNYSDAIKGFADGMDKHTGVEDKKYIDKVFEGLGTAVPYIAGGVAAKALQIPALVTSVGIGGLQALDSASNDYKELVSKDDPHASVKAAAVFGVDLALNIASHYLGPLSQGGSSGLLNSVGRTLKSTVLETANFGLGQTVVSNVATGRPPMQGVWDSVLTMLPMSLGFAVAGEAGNHEQIKQVESVIKSVAENGGTTQDTVKIISELSGVPNDRVQNTVDRYVADNPDVGDKYKSNVDKQIENITENFKAVSKAQAEAEYAKTKPAKARLFSENVEEPKPVVEPEKSPIDIQSEYEKTFAPGETEPSTNIEEPKPVEIGDTVDVKSLDGTVVHEGATIEKISEIDGKQYAKVEGSDTYTPLDQLEQKTEGKMKSSLKGQRIEASAIERGLTEGFKGTALYDAKTVKDQSERISELINNDFSRAERIVSGDEALPPGMSGSFLLNAMDDYARHTNDIDLIQKLANSPIASAGSIHAQELRFMREKNADSPVAKITEVKEEREKALEKKLNPVMGKKKSVAKAKTEVVDEIKKEINKNKVTQEDWSSFINSLEC